MKFLVKNDSVNKFLNILLLVFSLIVLLVFSLSCSKFIEQIDDDNTDTDPVVNTHLSNTAIIITFFEVPDYINISIPPLRYNKDFCLGFHLDDGANDIYTHAYKFLNGGIINGTSYNGLAYTDGCGNDINFKMSTSLYSLDNDENLDIHDPTTNDYYVKWTEVVEMYKSGWGVYNHGISAAPNSNYLQSIISNHNHVKSKTTEAVADGIEMKIFVNPDGDQNYTDFAFQENYRIAFAEANSFGKPYFDVTSTWSKSNIKMGRTLLIPQNSLTQLVDEMYSLSQNGAHYWGSVFSHSVTNSNYGISFNTFQNSMNYIESQYGKNGLDNIWMTTEEEVLEYFILKDEVVINQSLNGNILQISFSGNIPDDLRFYNLSLNLSTNKNITSIEIKGAAESSSFNGVNTSNALINIDCNNL